jgi:hypothetical protein
LGRLGANAGDDQEMMRKREQIEMMTNMYILIRGICLLIHEVLPPAANLERVNSALNTLPQLGI